MSFESQKKSTIISIRGQWKNSSDSSLDMITRCLKVPCSSIQRIIQKQFSPGNAQPVLTENGLNSFKPHVCGFESKRPYEDASGRR